MSPSPGRGCGLVNTLGELDGVTNVVLVSYNGD